MSHGPTNFCPFIFGEMLGWYQDQDFIESFLFFIFWLLFFVNFGVIMEQKEIKIISLKYRWKTNVKKISKVQEDAKGNSFVMETCILDVCVCGGVLS